MPTITIKNLDNKSVTFDNTSRSVLNVLHENNTDWMHACGAKGRCTTCKMIVHEGASELSDYSEFERKSLEVGKLKENERLACQCKALGDVVISVPESSKLPHLKYSL